MIVGTFLLDMQEHIKYIENKIAKNIDIILKSKPM